jgi:hypothetical protein
MGIKFNILSEILLSEASEFSKFFTSKAPIEQIHKALRIAHDAKVELIPTKHADKHRDALRGGDAIFVRENKPEKIAQTRFKMLEQFNQFTPTSGRGRDFNNVKTILNNIASLTTEEPVSPEQLRKIKRRVFGIDPTGNKLRTSVVELIKDMFPSGKKRSELITSIQAFRDSISPGEYVIMKSVPSNIGDFKKLSDKGVDVKGQAVQYQTPEQRRFDVFKKDAERIVMTPNINVTQDKVYGGLVMVWHLNENGIINIERIKANVIAAYNAVFPEANTYRDAFIIKNEAFQQAGQHPFVPSGTAQAATGLEGKIEKIDSMIEFAKRTGKGDLQSLMQQKEQIMQQIAKQRHSARGGDFVKIMPIDNKSVENFVGTAFNQFSAKIEQKIRENTERLKTNVHADIENISISEPDINKKIADLRRALLISTKGLSEVNKKEIFNKYLFDNPRLDINHLHILSGGVIKDPVNLYSTDHKNYPMDVEQWTELSKDAGLEAMKSIMPTEGIPNGNIPYRESEEITIRSKADRTQVRQIMTNSINKRIIDNYEMLDPRRRKEERRWVPIDPEFIRSYKSTAPTAKQVAIAFANIGEYNSFARNFVKFALEEIVPSPEVTELVDALGNF